MKIKTEYGIIKDGDKCPKCKIEIFKADFQPHKYYCEKCKSEYREFELIE